MNSKRGFADGIKLRRLGVGDYPVYPCGPVTPQNPVTGRGSELERIRLLRPLLTLNRAGAKARGWPGETSRGQGIGSVGCPLATPKDGVSDMPHSLRRCANGGSHQGVSPPRTVTKVLLGQPSSAWLMSIFQNHETQESLTPKKTRGHFLQVGSTVAVFSQSSWDHYTRASRDPACGHSRKRGRGFPEL